MDFTKNAANPKNKLWSGAFLIHALDNEHQPVFTHQSYSDYPVW